MALAVCGGRLVSVVCTSTRLTHRPDGWAEVAAAACLGEGDEEGQLPFHTSSEAIETIFGQE